MHRGGSGGSAWREFDDVDGGSDVSFVTVKALDSTFRRIRFVYTRVLGRNLFIFFFNGNWGKVGVIVEIVPSELLNPCTSEGKGVLDPGVSL